MLLAVTSSVPTVLEAFWGENPLEKAVTFLRMPSPIRTRKGAFDPTQKKGGGPSPPSLLSSSPKQGWQMAKLICFLLFAWAPGLGTKL